MADELGDVLWYAANLAEKLVFGLDEIAERNLRKIPGRWPAGRPDAADAARRPGLSRARRSPRRTTVRFVESEPDGNITVRLYGLDGKQLGNQLTDFAYEDDGYRYHDAFHLTYVAMLGWSPLTRYFFGRKRDSDRECPGGRGRRRRSPSRKRSQRSSITPATSVSSRASSTSTSRCCRRSATWCRGWRSATAPRTNGSRRSSEALRSGASFHARGGVVAPGLWRELIDFERWQTRSWTARRSCVKTPVP